MFKSHSGNEKYRVAAYERLSKEDDRKEESSSIESQRIIIESFAKFNKFNIIEHYSDDGFTGSNFNRPGFERLKSDIEIGRINCVIVKDLSRLGRELYLTGKYIEDYFLTKGVRFIAINDGYDSDVGDSMLGIRLSVNDMYLRDTSKKVRTSLDAKRKNGEHIGSYAKFGYLKDPNNKNHLIVDPYPSKIVKQMFEWALNGVGIFAIAKKLTEMKVPIPAIYKKESRITHNMSLNDNCGVWRYNTVKDILTSQIYLGHMVQGQYRKLSYNSKKLIMTPPNEWIIVKNTHEAIIDEETFERVQKIINQEHRSYAKREKRHIFQGLMVCKECGHQIGIYKKACKTPYYYIQCNHYARFSKYGECCSHVFKYELLEKDLLAYLRTIGKKFLETYDSTSLAQKSINQKEINNHYIMKSINEVKSSISKNQNILSNLYEDYLNEVISQKQYKTLSAKYETDLTNLENKLQKLEEQTNQKNDTALKKEFDKCKSLIHEFMSLKNPTNELMFHLIDKIIIDKNGNVEIFFNVNIKKYTDYIATRGEIVEA